MNWAEYQKGLLIGCVVIGAVVLLILITGCSSQMERFHYPPPDDIQVDPLKEP